MTGIFRWRAGRAPRRLGKLANVASGYPVNTMVIKCVDVPLVIYALGAGIGCTTGAFSPFPHTAFALVRSTGRKYWFAEAKFESDTHTVIVSLPSGTGKSGDAETMRERFGCIGVVDDWNSKQPITVGALHLTNEELFA